MKTYSIFTVATAFLAGLTVVGCSTSADDFAENGDGAKVAKLNVVTRATDAEAAYAHRTFLVSEPNIVDAKSAASASALTAFSVEAGSYEVYATAVNDEANLTFTGVAADNAVASARIKITDMTAQIPDLLIGKSAAVTVSTESTTASVELKRVVASLNVTVSGLENVDANTITLKIDNMYDQVDLNGTPMKSGAEFASKTLTLTKNATTSKYEGNAIVMPTDTEATTLALTYTVNGTQYTSTPTGKLAANGQYNLSTTVSSGAVTTFDVATTVTYAAWSTAISLTDSFTIEDATPAKAWTSAVLPISGAAAPSYDNFWASTSGDGGYDSYLYDGVKDDTSYWYPASDDFVAPCWYIDLGAAKQGVTIDYWNKFGGKGGGKIKTMDIYGSNTHTDYQNSTNGWTKITTFTSDKTKATDDAGAHLTTGQIKFSEDGTTSYKYIRCVITSRVDTNNNTDTTIDINVAEVEVTTWLYE